jgi:L-histidine N-alpha-methyltransferase
VEAKARIEMRLVSTRNQTVRVAALGRTFGFTEREVIHTENSHKYGPGAFERLASASGLRVMESWSDSRTWFTLALLARDDRRLDATGPCTGGRPT